MAGDIGLLPVAVFDLSLRLRKRRSGKLHAAREKHLRFVIASLPACVFRCMNAIQRYDCLLRCEREQ
jgi:hypothetical protein